MEVTPSEPIKDPIGAGELLVSGDLVLDLPAHQAWAGRRPIHLSHLQFVLLTTLVRRAGKVVTLEELTSAAAGVSPLTARTVSGAISRLRANLGTGPQRPRIEVARRRGYRLVTPGCA